MRSADHPAGYVAPKKSREQHANLGAGKPQLVLDERRSRREISPIHVVDEGGRRQQRDHRAFETSSHDFFQRHAEAAMLPRCVGPLTEEPPPLEHYEPRRPTQPFEENDMNNITQKSIRAALLTATLSAGFATVGTAADLPQVHVNYADLNVNSPAGATVLYQRIRRAADQVCPTVDGRDLAGQSAAKACKTRAIAEAVAAVQNPSLTHVYELKTGATPVARFASIR
jgi:UrcA family protein